MSVHLSGDRKSCYSLRKECTYTGSQFYGRIVPRIRWPEQAIPHGKHLACSNPIQGRYHGPQTAGEPAGAGHARTRTSPVGRALSAGSSSQTTPAASSWGPLRLRLGLIFAWILMSHGRDGRSDKLVR